MKTVKAIVGERETVTVGPHASVLDATRLMTTRRIGAVPVVEGDQLTGVFTERDIMTRVVAAGLDAASTPVADVMSTRLITAAADESYEACLTRMQDSHVRHIVVLDRGRLAGIVSLRDLMAADLVEKDEAIMHLNAYVHYVPADLHAKT